MKKMNNTLLFSRFGKPENFRKLFAKEEEEKEEEVQRDSKVLKDCKFVVKRLLKCKSKSCFYRLFKSSQENHWKSYNI